MAIQKIVKEYLNEPLPLWENEITQRLVEYEWAALALQYKITPNTYTIAKCVLKDKSVTETNLSLPITNSDIKIALPSEDLKGFYEEHGIQPVEITTVESSNEVSKIISALDVLKHIEPVHDFISKIVKSVQLIKATYTDTDVSYSHPEIPFSIFFSVCNEVSTISDLRVAESILHEAMHLKLTLIENHVNLIEPNSEETFYSPWREENRPLRGVLHGMFVFKAIKDFYILLLNNDFSKIWNDTNYLNLRVEEINKNFSELIDFSNTVGLTNTGKILVERLLEDKF